MTDFFREVDEELRNERMRRLWKNYGKYFIALIVLIIAATAGYRYYLHWDQTQAGVSGDRYLEALQLVSDGKRDEAQKIFSELEENGYGAYPILAKFSAASSLVAAGNKQEALSAFDELSINNEPTKDLADYARLQAALIAVDLEDYASVQSRTEPLLGNDNPWRYLAREALALSAWNSGQIDEAAKWLSEIKAGTLVPQGLRQRITLLEDLIVGAGGKLPEVGISG